MPCLILSVPPYAFTKWTNYALCPSNLRWQRIAKSTSKRKLIFQIDINIIDVTNFNFSWGLWICGVPNELQEGLPVMLWSTLPTVCPPHILAVLAD